MIDPNIVGSYFILGALSFQKGLIDDAIRSLEKALKLKTTSFTKLIYMLLAKCYFEKKNIEKSLECQIKSLDCEDSIPKIKNVLESFIKIHLDQYFLTIYNTRINTDENDIKAMERLAIIYYLRNEIENSKSMFNNIIIKDNKNQIANYYLGIISQNIGKIEEAYKYYNSLISNENTVNFIDKTRYLLSSENLNNILQDYLISTLQKYGDVSEEFVMMQLFDIIQCSNILRKDTENLYVICFSKLLDEQKINEKMKKKIILQSWNYRKLFLILLSPKLINIYNKLIANNNNNNWIAYYQSHIISIEIILIKNLLDFYENNSSEELSQFMFIKDEIDFIKENPLKYKEHHLEKALDKLQNILNLSPNEKEIYLYIVLSIAEICRELNKNDEAINFYNKALKSIEDKKSLEYLNIDRDIAIIKKDKIHLKDISETAVSRNLHYFASETLYELAIIDKENQIKYLVEAVELFDKSFDNLNDEKFKYGFLNSKMIIYKRLINKLLEINKIKEAYYYLERSKSKYFIEMMKKVRNKIIEEEEDIEWPYRGDYFTRVYERQEKFNNKFILPIDNEILFKIMPIIDNINPVIFIQYYIYNQKTISIFVFYKDPNANINVNVCIYSEIPKIYQRNDHKSKIYDNENLEDLYNKLFKPVIEMLTKGIYSLSELKNIHFIIIPDMYLHNVPFLALKNSITQKYIIEEEYMISTIPSLTTMLILLDRPIKSSFSDIFGIDLIGYSNKYNKIGINNIVDSLNYNKIVIEEENDKLKLKIKINQSYETVIDWEWNNINDVLSISRNLSAYIFTGHGIYCQDIFQSYIDYNKYQGKNDERWKLYLKDIYEYNFNYSIVILLACFTGIIDSVINYGDEIIGLLRGFYLANSRAIIGTLWETESFANQEFIKNFLTYLRESNYIDIALKKAMLKLMAINHNPIFWGAYFLSGDPRKL